MSHDEARCAAEVAAAMWCCEVMRVAHDHLLHVKNNMNKRVEDGRDDDGSAMLIGADGRPRAPTAHDGPQELKCF